MRGGCGIPFLRAKKSLCVGVRIFGYPEQEKQGGISYASGGAQPGGMVRENITKKIGILVIRIPS